MATYTFKISFIGDGEVSGNSNIGTINSDGGSRYFTIEQGYGIHLFPSSLYKSNFVKWRVYYPSGGYYQYYYELRNTTLWITEDNMVIEAIFSSPVSFPSTDIQSTEFYHHSTNYLRLDFSNFDEGVFLINRNNNSTILSLGVYDGYSTSGWTIEFDQPKILKKSDYTNYPTLSIYFNNEATEGNPNIINYIWKPNTFTITYDANRGSVSTTTQDVTVGSSTTTPVATRNNGTSSRTVHFNANGGTTTKSSQVSSATITYTSNGWYTAASGGTKRASNGGSYTPTTSETLYAQWNSSTGTYSAITFPSVSECIRDGYTLLGFSSNSTATAATYAPGTSHIVAGTYYAIWKKTITLTYDSNNGSGTLPENQNATIYNGIVSASFIVDPNSQASLSRTGHTFLGWSTSSDATAASYSQGDTINIFDDTILYAVWETNQYKIIASTYLINEDGSETETITGGWVKGIGSYNYNTQQTITAVRASALYSFYKWENGSTNPVRTITIPANDINVTAYFVHNNLTLVANNVDDGDISLWIREKNITDNTYKDWRLYDWELGEFSLTSDIVQFIVEDGENYEFTEATISQGTAIAVAESYVDYTIGDSTILMISSQPIPVSNKIFVGGKTNGLKTSGYIKDPNVSFEEPIKSIWIGNQQIMGKSPSEIYPYKEDSLLIDTLYINNQNTILNKSYQNNTSIKKIIIPKNITTIGANYLRSCTNLKTIKFLQNSQLTSLGNYAFAEDNSLLKIYLPDKLQNIGEGAFQQCTRLQKIILPASVSTIQQYAFYNCINLQSLKLNHTKITELPYSVFMYCSNLKTVFLPKTLTSIGARAFYQCNSLEKIIYMGTIEDWNKITIPAHGNTYLNGVPIQCIDGITYTNLE